MQKMEQKGLSTYRKYRKPFLFLTSPISTLKVTYFAQSEVYMMINYPLVKKRILHAHNQGFLL